MFPPLCLFRVQCLFGQEVRIDAASRESLCRTFRDLVRPLGIIGRREGAVSITQQCGLLLRHGPDSTISASPLARRHKIPLDIASGEVVLRLSIHEANRVNLLTADQRLGAAPPASEIWECQEEFSRVVLLHLIRESRH
jgi:hypothetical protein